MIRFIFIGFNFWVSSRFIFEYNDDTENTFIGVYILFVSALGSGISLSQAPSIGKAKHASKKIFGIIDEPSKIDSRESSGETLIKKGEIEFKNVDFKYPSR